MPRNVFAASDMARWPDPYSGEWLRIKHWVVAERQDQTAALNMLGRRERRAAGPFFWRQHYDISIDRGGHAAWDRIAPDGGPGADDVALRFQKDGRTLVLVTIFRGRENRDAERAVELARSR